MSDRHKHESFGTSPFRSQSTVDLGRRGEGRDGTEYVVEGFDKREGSQDPRLGVLVRLPWGAVAMSGSDVSDTSCGLGRPSTRPTGTAPSATERTPDTGSGQTDTRRRRLEASVPITRLTPPVLRKRGDVLGAQERHPRTPDSVKPLFTHTHRGRVFRSSPLDCWCTSKHQVFRGVYV